MIDWLATLTESPVALSCSVALAALILEFLLPIPKKYHPLAFARLLALRMASKVRPSKTSSKQQQLISGSLSFPVLFGPILLVVYLLLEIADYKVLLDVVIVWVSIGFGGEKAAFKRVQKALRQEKKLLARQWVTELVKRDTHSLSDIGIAKAAMESLLLRLVYQLVTPLFVFFVIGPISALTYRLMLECYWQWKRPFSAQSPFAKPIGLLCKACQWCPMLIVTLLSFCILMPRNTAVQQRTSVKTSPASASSTALLFSAVGKRLGFAIGGPLEYAGKRTRLPRYGAHYQVRFSDMSAVYNAVTAVTCVVMLSLTLAIALSL